MSPYGDRDFMWSEVITGKNAIAIPGRTVLLGASDLDPASLFLLIFYLPWVERPNDNRKWDLQWVGVFPFKNYVL